MAEIEGKMSFQTYHKPRMMPRSNALERTDAMFTSIARFFHALRRYEAAMQELSHLSDRELADIGTNRAESRLAWEHAHSSLR
jgi:uncharacterized protein YjiS (DUF1127 family)